MDCQLVPAAQLTWSPQLRLTHAEGDCLRVLRRPAEALLGLSLDEALGITQEDAAALLSLAAAPHPTDRFLRAHPGGEETFLRLTLWRSERGPAAAILDLPSLLVGAPPFQVSQLASSLSHEIRNPLSSVKMAVQTLARNQGLSERDQRRLAIAHREIRTMERTLSLLSEYGRQEAANLEPVSLPWLVRESAALVEPELEERRATLAIDAPADLPRILAEPARFRPVLAQLLLNVATGQPEGAQLPLRLFEAPEGVCLALEDPTWTLPPSAGQAVFEPFSSRLARGAGLSLAALKRAMINQKGSVRAEAGAGPGTRFLLTFAPA